MAEYAVAGAVTLPGLEDNQFCCKQLREYILKGRDHIKEYEDACDEEQPSLFTEYQNADMKYKGKIEIQLKLIKRHSRLTAEKVWYTWRFEYFTEGRIAAVNTDRLENLAADRKVVEVTRKELKLQMAKLRARRDTLRKELAIERQLAEELKDCDLSEVDRLKEGIAEQAAELSEWKDKVDVLQRDLTEIEEQTQRQRSAVDADKSEIVRNKQRYDTIKGHTIEEAQRRRDDLVLLQQVHGWTIDTLHPQQPIFVSQLPIPMRLAWKGTQAIIEIMSQPKSSQSQLYEFLCTSIQSNIQLLGDTTLSRAIAYVSAMSLRAQSILYDAKLLSLQWPLTFVVQGTDELDMSLDLLLPTQKSSLNVTLKFNPKILQDPATSIISDAIVNYGDASRSGFLKRLRPRLDGADCRRCLSDAFSIVLE